MNGPDGFELFEGHESAIFGSSKVSPDEFSVRCPDAVDPAVVGSEVNASIFDGRWRVNSAAGCECPSFFTGPGVERVDSVRVDLCDK